jgi:glycosyltransferase family 2
MNYLNKASNNKPMVSIITVVFNGEKYLEQTIKSIVNQTYKNFEYIIIDGGSTDGTIGIIKKYEDKISYWISEKDNGIYDAMNKGIEKANGDWINFMNAGDSFYMDNILENIFLQNDFKNIDVIYGNHNVIYPNKTKIKKAGDINNIWKGSQFCHQSSFVSSRIHKQCKFNTSNRIGADFEFFYTIYKKGNVKFKYVDIVMVNYFAGGLSDIERVDSIVGWWNVVKKDTKVNLYYIYIILKEIIKKYIKNIFRYIKSGNSR